MSCRAPRNGTGRLPDPVAVPRLIPVYIPPDSAWLRAYMECDSNNQVIMKAFDEQKGSGVSSSLRLNEGMLDYRILFLHDTIRIAAKDSLIYVPVPTPGPVTNVLTWWQQLWIKIGKLSVSFAAGWLLFCLLRKRFN